MLALIGGFGSIGRRYQAACRFLDIPFEIIDLPLLDPEQRIVKLKEFSHVLIASPTPTHADWVKAAVIAQVPVLCEKPLTKNTLEAQGLEHLVGKTAHPAFVVNNWDYAIRSLKYEHTRIDYDFFNTGRDGLVWDVCQLVYLAETFYCPLTVNTDSPIWNVWIGDSPMPYRTIEQSYLHMVYDFWKNRWAHLWTLSQGRAMTEMCSELEVRLGEGSYEGFMCRPGQKQVHKITRENLSKHRSQKPFEVGV